MGTLIVLVILILSVCLVIKGIIRDKKNGKSIRCSGDCGQCGSRHCNH